MCFFITSQHIVTAAVKPGKMAKQTGEREKEKGRETQMCVCVGRGEGGKEEEKRATEDR